VYKLIVRRIVRRKFRRLSAGDCEPIVRQFGPHSRFLFAGDHALGGERRGPQEVREWFKAMLGLFPGIRIEPREVLVNGWPWDTVVATHLLVHATLGDGRAYANEGMQLLRLRWGRVVEDLVFEDTLKLESELRRRTAAEAAAPA
jgi:ketosteroid isomerase-like protein